MRKRATKRTITAFESGGGEIRTPETGVTRLLVFKTSAFNHSATPPRVFAGANAKGHSTNG
jgi:hypothetical protein